MKAIISDIVSLGEISLGMEIVSSPPPPPPSYFEFIPIGSISNNE